MAIACRRILQKHHPPYTAVTSIDYPSVLRHFSNLIPPSSLHHLSSFCCPASPLPSVLLLLHHLHPPSTPIITSSPPLHPQSSFIPPSSLIPPYPTPPLLCPPSILTPVGEGLVHPPSCLPASRLEGNLAPDLGPKFLVGPSDCSSPGPEPCPSVWQPKHPLNTHRYPVTQLSVRLLTAPSPLSSPPVLLREEVAQLQEEVHLLRQMKDMLSRDLEESHQGSSADLLSAAELRVQLAQKEEELDRAKEALQVPSVSAPPHRGGLRSRAGESDCRSPRGGVVSPTAAATAAVGETTPPLGERQSEEEEEEEGEEDPFGVRQKDDFVPTV
ncbi:unnamed protein product [Boreogadus saida]